MVGIRVRIKVRVSGNTFSAKCPFGQVYQIHSYATKNFSNHRKTYPELHCDVLRILLIRILFAMLFNS